MKKYLFFICMAFTAITSLAFISCSSDDDNSGNNGSTMVSVKYAATGEIVTYHLIRADYVSWAGDPIAPSNDICFSATFSEDEDAFLGWYLQFYIKSYKDESGQIKEYTGLSDLKVGTHLIFSSKDLFFYLEGGSGGIDDVVYGASDPHGDAIVKSLNGGNITLELKDFSFKGYSNETETIVNGTIEYIPDSSN